MSKIVVATGVQAGLGILAGVSLLATRAKVTPEEPEAPGLIPTVDDIMASSTVGDLEIFYIYIGQLYVRSQIDRVKYETLYQAYVTRFYQLIGDNQ